MALTHYDQQFQSFTGDIFGSVLAKNLQHLEYLIFDSLPRHAMKSATYGDFAFNFFSLLN